MADDILKSVKIIIFRQKTDKKAVYLPSFLTKSLIKT